MNGWNPYRSSKYNSHYELNLLEQELRLLVGSELTISYQISMKCIKIYLSGFLLWNKKSYLL